ncbi:hypothetical protein HD806DRAFT_512658 [Xylariaceae sp. AK1471]|nr:hypothetical protein HD806DRAFT_512658 [Xylariaceae sp. AK1471]
MHSGSCCAPIETLPIVTMASPQLAIAKVSLSAVLLRADPTSCPRTEIDDFLGRLDATISRCSPPNVQKCKQWIFANLAQSPTRVAALAKYLVALTNTYSAELAATREAREPSSKRKRLHLLYILNDALYQAHVRDQNPSFAANLELALPSLFLSAAAFPNAPKQIKKLLALLDIWEENRYYQSDFIDKLRQAVRDGPRNQDSVGPPGSSANGLTNTSTKSSRDAPFIMPTMHGDTSSPWYDLPAANWLPVIEPNSTRPMNPEMIKPLRFATGPVDKQLIKAVQDLLADVDRIYSKECLISDDRTEDIDQMGQRVILDEITGEIIGGETYYGWSRPFCQKMKQRRKKKAASGNGERGRSTSRSPSRSRSRSRSSSRGSSRPAFKRRRISASPASPDSRQSRSRSRSRSYDRGRDYSRGRHRQRSYNSSRSRSRAQSRSRSQGHSPPPAAAQQRSYIKSTSIPNPGPNLPPNSQFLPQQSLFMQQGFPPVPPDFNQFPVPPPLPPNYQGPWPPPPPPPPAGGMPPNWMPPMPNMGGGWPAPPPPPPPQQQQHGGGGYQQYGRGGRGEYRGQGYRGGGWNRGRGW